jgi:hypothetical protein
VEDGAGKQWTTQDKVGRSLTARYGYPFDPQPPSALRRHLLTGG